MLPLNAASIVSTVVGAQNASFYCSSTNGQALLAGLGNVQGLALDPVAKRLYWVDAAARSIRMLDQASGLTSDVAGQGCPTNNAASYVDGPAASACFSAPNSIALAPNGMGGLVGRGGEKLHLTHADLSFSCLNLSFVCFVLYRFLIDHRACQPNRLLFHLLPVPSSLKHYAPLPCILHMSR